MLFNRYVLYIHLDVNISTSKRKTIHLKPVSSVSAVIQRYGSLMRSIEREGDFFFFNMHIKRSRIVKT